MRNPLCLLPLTLAACSTSSEFRQEADADAYAIQEVAFDKVTGQRKTVSIERPVDRLRRRLETGSEQVVLDLRDALDVAAENSREFQRQKENLYQAALGLTRAQWDFSVRFGGGSSDEISGVNDDQVGVNFRNDLSAAANTTSGGRIVASFVNTFLRSLINGGGWDSSSLINLTFTQPLLRGAGRRIAREPLTQAERDVVYAVRDFERFRATFAVQIVSQYYRVLQQMANLEIEDANLKSTRENHERTEAFVEAERQRRVQAGRTEQSVFVAEDRKNTAIARLESQLDQFKQTLGLPTEARVQLDPKELEKIRAVAVEEVAVDEQRAVELALRRRLDHRNSVDDVADSGRRVLVAEDALRSSLDFSSALQVPTDSDQPLKFDWDRVGWSLGFDLDLALDRLPERNSYRTSLINLDLALRNREQSRDRVVAQVRDALRNIRRTVTSHRIQTLNVRVTDERAQATRELFLANREEAFEVTDAQTDLLSAQLAYTGAIVDYLVARLELLRDLEGLVLEPKGLRYDPALPLPGELAAAEAPPPTPDR